jgi:hypothetical protein
VDFINIRNFLKAYYWIVLVFLEAMSNPKTTKSTRTRMPPVKAMLEKGIPSLTTLEAYSLPANSCYSKLAL